MKDKISVLPNADKAVIPAEKFTDYALNTVNAPDKALAFERALGYNAENADKLIANIKENLQSFSAANKGDKGYGEKYEVIMTLTGENGKTAKVLTAWIDDAQTGDMRLITAYVDD
jgi:hypothetical protein